MGPLEDPETRPEPSLLEERLATAVTAAAAIFVAAFASWGLFGPILAGHDAALASMGIIAENMHRWGIAAPVWQYTSAQPDPSLYYAHHPWGIFWTSAAFFGVFGRADFVCRLPAVLLSAATPVLVAAVGRALHRPLAGAVGAAAFAVLPITLSFAHFNALEVPLMAYGALFLWGWVRFRATLRRRHLAAMLAGAVLGVNADWPAFVLVATVLAIDLGSFAVGPRSLPRRRVIGWAALAAAAAVVGAGYLFVFFRFGKLGDLLASYELRSGGDHATFGVVLEQRRYWDELMFTPVAIALGHVGAVVTLARAALLRRAVELAPIAALGMALFQYAAFPQGAMIHVFWPHTFALYIGLAMGSLAATVAPPIAALARARGGRLAGRGSILTLALCLAPLFAIVPDAVATAAWARRTGGRFDEKGAFIETAADDIHVLHELARELAPSELVGLHESVGPTWAHAWALGGRPVDASARLPTREDGADHVVVADLRGLRPREIELLVVRRRVEIIGSLAVIRPGPAALSARSFALDEPTFADRVFGAPFEPVRRTVEDPWAGWQITRHFGQTEPPPDAPPATLEQRAVAYGAALEAGAPERADRLREQILAELDGPILNLPNGVTLLGVQPRGTAARRLLVVFQASGPVPEGGAPRLEARSRRPVWSTVRAPAPRRDLGPRWPIAPSRWMPDFIYAVEVPLLERPGVEAFELVVDGGRGRHEIFRL